MTATITRTITEVATVDLPEARNEVEGSKMAANLVNDLPARSWTQVARDVSVDVTA